MPNEKCCYDCAWCIMTCAPIECGAIYECVNPLSDKHNENSIDPWGKHCKNWRGKGMDNRCIYCGEIIPEGRLVCPNCEKKEDPKKGK